MIPAINQKPNKIRKIQNSRKIIALMDLFRNITLKIFLKAF